MSEEVAPGIFRLGNRTVNWWVLVSSDGITLIDAGLRAHLGQLEHLLSSIGRSVEDIRCILLTHADVDHIGVAEDLRRRGVGVFIHESDGPAATGEMRPLPKQALLSAWRPSALVAAAEYARDGALKPRFLREVELMSDGDVLPVPGSPRVLHVPGHSAGSCAFFLPEGGVLFTGDALVTADPLTGKRKPTLLPSYDNQDHARAMKSLEKLAATGADLVLTGHGAAWSAGVSKATEIALSS